MPSLKKIRSYLSMPIDYLYYYIFHSTTYVNIVENPAAPLNIFDIILATGCHWMAKLARDVMMEQPDWKNCKVALLIASKAKINFFEFVAVTFPPAEP